MPSSYHINHVFIDSKGGSASVATALSAGQRHIFEQRDTWFPHTRQPTVAMWGEGVTEDPNIDDFRVTSKNFKQFISCIPTSTEELLSCLKRLQKER